MISQDVVCSMKLWHNTAICCEERILQVPGRGRGESARGSQDKHSVTPTWPTPPFHLPVPYVDDEFFFFNGTAGIKWDYVALGFRGGGGGGEKKRH